MPNPEPNKRQLKFTNFDELFAEVDSLLESGYTANGNWNLAQTLTHIAHWMRYPLDGFPNPPLLVKAIFWMLRVTIGGRMKRKILANGFSGGMMTAPQSVPAADEQSDQEAYQFLKQTVERVKHHEGDFLPSPLFGPLDKDLLTTITLLHSEHHLGYLAAQPSSGA